MGAWIDAVFGGMDLAIFTFMHDLATLMGENAGAEITSFFTHLMNFVSFFDFFIVSIKIIAVYFCDKISYSSTVFFIFNLIRK